MDTIFPTYHKDIQLVETRDDGSCFFDAVHKAIGSDMSSDEGVLFLRKVVAKKVIVGGRKMNKIINFWREVYKSALKEKNYTLLGEMNHVACVRDIPLSRNLARFERKMVAEAMLSNRFWGEEFCVRELGEFLNVCFIIVDGNYGKIRPVINPEDENSEYIFLFLYNGHYRLLTYRGKSVHTRGVAIEICSDYFKKNKRIK